MCYTNLVQRLVQLHTKTIRKIYPRGGEGGGGGANTKKQLLWSNKQNITKDRTTTDFMDIPGITE